MTGTPQKAPPDDSKGTTLFSFIEENHRLLSVLGIFTALTVFARTLPIRILSDLLSFFFLAATVVLWFELQERYPSKTSSQKLRLFEILVSTAVLLLVACWLFLYWAFWRRILVAVFFAAFSLATTSLLQKYNVFNRLVGVDANHQKFLRHLVFFIIFSMILVSSIFFANLLGLKVVPLLEQIHEQLQENPG